jgi:engulfment and cell motility protein 1
MESSPNITELVERLGSDEDPIRKKAAYTLSSNIGDPSFADIFITEGGLFKLRWLIHKANGNTLAYSLKAFEGLLELDKGWDCIDQELVQRVCWNGLLSYQLTVSDR